MPVEQLRKHFARDLSLYPDLALGGYSYKDPEQRESPSVLSISSTSSSSTTTTTTTGPVSISIASTSSSQSEQSQSTATSAASSAAAAPTKPKSSRIIISSDEGSDSEVERELTKVSPQARAESESPPESKRLDDLVHSHEKADGPVWKQAPTIIPIPPEMTRTLPTHPSLENHNASMQKPVTKMTTAVTDLTARSSNSQARTEPESRPDHQYLPNYERADKPAFKSTPTVIPAPSNGYSKPTTRPPTGNPNISMPEPVINMTATDADKAVKDLMAGSVNEDIEAEINPDDLIVPAFYEEFKLLPHQALGRIWMRERETGKKAGGILADDMGLGKTIQTLARIAEGRARKSDAQEGWSACTLVVCPLALINQWAEEVKRMVPGFTVAIHHGTSRPADPSTFRTHIVVTTYDVVKFEYEAYQSVAKNEAASKQLNFDSGDDDESDTSRGPAATKAKPKAKGRNSKKSALFKVKWWRVVLDEAHNIKNEKTKGAIACCELKAKYRWCLTGTPMQNNVQELYSLFKFLRIKPLSDWPSFDTQIGRPLKTGKNAGSAMKKLRAVLQEVMLRRTKDQTLNGQRLIELPKRIVNIVSCQFDSTEQAFYDALETKMGDTLEKLMTSNTGRSTYISVLLLLLRLRQACDHPALVTKDFKKDVEAVDPKSVKKGSSDKDGDADDLAAAFNQLGVSKKCQMCTTELSSSNAGEGKWSDHCIDCVPLAMQAQEIEHGLPSSAKIRKILEILREVQKQGPEKTIIFSQFTSMLDLIELFLKNECIKYVRYDGSMKPPEREAALAKIKENPDTRVILISFKAGSTGLNLTACNNVILVDLWWNPALEDQAFDRAHRFGQERDVNIYKLKIDSTVEDRILELQERKRLLARAALSGTKLKDMHLGFEELLALLKWDKEDSDY